MAASGTFTVIAIVLLFTVGPWAMVPFCLGGLVMTLWALGCEMQLSNNWSREHHKSRIKMKKEQARRRGWVDALRGETTMERRT